ncbi:MAG: hypothetical protein L0220_33395, partial [Acidobacteria bacterium]|nr:hypothetical protein [Acidobacteriota bacterium]
MNLITTKSEETIEHKAGVLFQQKAEKESHESVLRPAVKEKEMFKHRLAFCGLYLLTLLMYLRPHEIKPGWFGSF